MFLIYIAIGLVAWGQFTGQAFGLVELGAVVAVVGLGIAEEIRARVAAGQKARD